MFGLCFRGQLPVEPGGVALLGVFLDRQNLDPGDPGAKVKLDHIAHLHIIGRPLGPPGDPHPVIVASLVGYGAPLDKAGDL